MLNFAPLQPKAHFFAGEINITLYAHKLSADISITKFFYISDYILVILRNRDKLRP